MNDETQQKGSSDMINIETKHDGFTAFGGLAHIFNAMESCGILKLIDKELGLRGVRRSSFSYADVFKSLAAIYLTGGGCLEDVNRTRDFWSGESRIPSPDVIGRSLKELKAAGVYRQSEKNAAYKFNMASRMNRLLVKSARMLGQFPLSGELVIDYDNQLIATEKKDAEYSYKHLSGYFPGVAAIGPAIVYLENRDGNASVKFCQRETLRRMFGHLKKELPGREFVFRADAGSYTKEVLEMVSGECSRFFVRANACGRRRAMYEEYKGWREAGVNGERLEVADFCFDDFDRCGHLRLVVQRAVNDDGESPDLFGKQYTYRAILTNDFLMTGEEVISFYNQRGAAERNFDMQNNDFGWSHMPFSDMAENTVFLIMTAILKNFYGMLAREVSRHVPGLKATSRVKRFVNKFVSVPAKWVRTGRRRILKLFSPYNFYDRFAYRI
jgi:hypothetical protein